MKKQQVVLKADNMKIKLPHPNSPCPCGRINPSTNKVIKWKRCHGRIRAENIIKGFQEHEEKKKLPPAPAEAIVEHPEGYYTPKGAKGTL